MKEQDIFCNDCNNTNLSFREKLCLRDELNFIYNERLKFLTKLFNSLEYVKNCLNQLILEHAQEQNITTDCS